MFNADYEERMSQRHGSRAAVGGRPLDRRTLVLAIAMALVLGVVGGGALGVLLRPPAPGPGTGTAYLYLTIGFDFATGLDRYLPANVTVPAHTLIVVSITNYDNTSNPVPGPSASVVGTVGGIMVMQSAADAQGMPMSAVSPAQVAHTFTMDGGPYSLNVPIPAAASRSNPMTVTFRAYFNVTGAFAWHCDAPCDTPSMTTPGFMRGTVTVVDS